MLSSWSLAVGVQEYGIRPMREMVQIEGNDTMCCDYQHQLANDVIAMSNAHSAPWPI